MGHGVLILHPSGDKNKTQLTIAYLVYPHIGKPSCTDHSSRTILRHKNQESQNPCPQTGY